ncbi:MAG TPA: peptide-methionine (S)-S-oxide reductase [Saprospiraceae bacterium]|nr:peptide-methionine (S)-S-oxide reductase [Saprospiraceae bacterium]
MTKKYEEATFGAGCFWCVEAIFQDLKGVLSVESGYAGGKLENPSYEAVSTGLSGHVEVIRIKFDPAVITFADLVRVLFVVHDPTTLNRQGNDVGTQYRSVIFYENEEQHQTAIRIKEEFETKKIYDKPIVTAIEPLNGNYYPAEQYHQNYYNEHPDQPYCRAVIAPKVQKFRSHYLHLLKKQ